MPDRIFESDGRSFSYDGQRYCYIESRPHECRSGVVVRLGVYTSACASCGAPFEASAPIKSRRRFAINRRCPDHRMPGRPVHPAAPPKSKQR